jgi:hypothetical protein
MKPLAFLSLLFYGSFAFAQSNHTAKEILKVCIGDTYLPLKWLSY